MGSKNTDYDKFKADVIKFIVGSLDDIECRRCTATSDIWSRNGYRYSFQIDKENQEDERTSKSTSEQH